MHNHTLLHYNQNHQAECLICGEIVGAIYFPDLSAWFSVEEYNTRLQNYDGRWSVNSTWTASKPTKLTLE